MDMRTTDPEAYRAMMELDGRIRRSAADAGLEPRLVELVKIRASQLNGCAFCLRMHTRDAIAHGETADRLAVLPAWRETACFSPAERAALRISERVTRIGAGGEQHERVGRSLDVEGSALDERQLAAVAWIAVAIDAWNRIAITSRYEVAPEG